MTPTAFSPGSVTCFFVPNMGTAPEDASSPGCGICISDGVTAALRPATRVLIRFNGEELDLPPVRTVVEELAPEPVEVFLETPVPLGCGFGISAASCLATAFALARRFGQEQSRQELGTIALRAEIRHRTGIGDPITQITGGVVLRRWRTGPFDCQALNLVPAASPPLFYRAFGPLSTKAVLSDPPLVRRLADAGMRCLGWLEEHQAGVTLEDILERSLEFAEGVGLVTDPRVCGAIADVQRRQGKATMVMLGQSVLASRLPADAADWRECRIDWQGTRYLT
jgi:pantoate kinase